MLAHLLITPLLPRRRRPSPSRPPHTFSHYLCANVKEKRETKTGVEQLLSFLFVVFFFFLLVLIIFIRIVQGQEKKPRIITLFHPREAAVFAVGGIRGGVGASWMLGRTPVCPTVACKVMIPLLLEVLKHNKKKGAGRVATRRFRGLSPSSSSSVSKNYIRVIVF